MSKKTKGLAQWSHLMRLYCLSYLPQSPSDIFGITKTGEPRYPRSFYPRIRLFTLEKLV
jgi:hypothetical protein